MRLVVAVLGLTGCNLVFTAAPDDVPGDALDAPPGTRCDPMAPFGAGVAIDAAGRSVEAARFTRDERLAYVSTCPVNAGVVLTATCDLAFAQFDSDAPAVANTLSMTGVNSANCYDAYPTISADGKHILYASTRDPNSATCDDLLIWVASARGGTFDMPDIVKFAGVPPGSCANEPYVVGDAAQNMYYSSVPCTGGLSDLKVARGEPPTYANAEVMDVPGVNTSTEDEFAPVVSEDEREIFFARGSAAGQTLDIFHARRAAPGAMFSTPERMLEHSSPGIDWPVWLSPDSCRLYYIKKPSKNSLATLFVARRDQ